MFPLGNDLDDVIDALSTHHEMRVRLIPLKLDHSVDDQGELTARILEGQVNVDMDAEVTRSATLTLSDPKRSLSYESNSPGDGALYADRMLQILYGVRVAGGEWVDIPIFTGPITKFERNGARVKIECQGKEVLARGARWNARDFNENSLKVDAILDVLKDTGETKFAFSRPTGKFAAKRSIGAEELPWEWCKAVAKTLSMQLFYDGAGYATLFAPGGSKVWTFTESNISREAPPVVTFDTENLKNAVRVIGKKRRHSTVKAEAVADASHPLSPERLGRNGKRRYLATFIQDEEITSDADARKLANDTLNEALLQLVTFTFDATVVPFLEGFDVIGLDLDDLGEVPASRMMRCSFPLTAAGKMSVGYTRRVDRPKRRT